MSIDVIKEYLVKVNWKTDQQSWVKMQGHFKAFEKQLGDFAKTIGGKVTLGVTAVIGALTLASGAILKFGEVVAKADQKIELMAVRLFTTERNARSLDAVMKAMNLSIEDLREVSLNPELRQQFLSLRHMTAGMEPGKDIQEGLQNIRQMGYEWQRLQIVAGYALTYIAGFLGKHLAEPMAKISMSIRSVTNMLGKTMPDWTERLAKILATVVKITDVVWRIIAGVTKLVVLIASPLVRWAFNMFDKMYKAWERMPGLLKAVVVGLTAITAAIMSGGWGLIIGAVAALGLLADDYFTHKEGGESFFGTMWDDLEKFVITIVDGIKKIAEGFAKLLRFLGVDGATKTDVNGEQRALNKRMMQKIFGVAEGDWEATTGHAGRPSGGLAIGKGVQLAPHMQKAVEHLGKVLEGWTVTSGMENLNIGSHRASMRGNPNSHASGNKIDLAGRMDSPQAIAKAMIALMKTPGFEHAMIDTSGARYKRAIQMAGDQIDPSKFSRHQGASTGQHIDAKIVPSVTIHVNGAGDPKKVADETYTRWNQAVRQRDMRGAYA